MRSPGYTKHERSDGSVWLERHDASDPQSKQGGGIPAWEPRSWVPKRLTKEELMELDKEILDEINGL